jgi:DNA-binding Lrp family transcriptional regulator
MRKGGQNMRRLEMQKAREILRLKHDLGLSLREIGNSCNCSKSSVSEVLERTERAKIIWPTEMSLNPSNSMGLKFGSAPINLKILWYLCL